MGAAPQIGTLLVDVRGFPRGAGVMVFTPPVLVKQVSFRDSMTATLQSWVVMAERGLHQRESHWLSAV